MLTARRVMSASFLPPAGGSAPCALNSLKNLNIGTAMSDWLFFFLPEERVNQ